MKKSLHEFLIERACSEGWSRHGWKKAFSARIMKRPFKDDGEEMAEDINDTRCLPDAWRIKVEGSKEGWCGKVLALEFLEVEVSHHLTEAKMEVYARLWWLFDASDTLHFRVFRMDRFGIVTPLVTEDTIYTIHFRFRH